MTLRHMKIFESVYRNGNITRAAEELHLVQPSVSLAVKEIETYYGIRLFERMGRRIYPTEGAKEFYGYALHIVSLFEEMETKIRNWDEIGTLRIGTSITIGTHILPGLIRKYQEKYPKLKVEAVISKSSDIEKDVLENQIDIGLIETKPEHPDLCCIPFQKDEMCAIVGNQSSLADLKEITLLELSKHPFLMREKGSAGREMLEACFSVLQISVHPLWESASTQAIVHGVAEGLGVAVLPYMLVQKDIQEGLVKRIPLHEKMQRELNVIHHRSKYLTPNMNAFISLCKKDQIEPDGCKS